MDDELVDDVFEDDYHFNPKNYYQNTDTGLNLNEATFFNDETPSPTSGHPAFRNNDRKSASSAAAAPSNPNATDINDFDDGWKSFKIEDDNGFDESILHKVKTTKWSLFTYTRYTIINYWILLKQLYVMTW